MDDSNSHDSGTPEHHRSPVKSVENSPRPSTPDPVDVDLSPSKRTKKEPIRPKTPKITSPGKRTRSGLPRPATPHKVLSPTRFASRPTSPKSEVSPSKLTKSKSQPTSPISLTAPISLSPTKRTSRTPGHSPKKLSRSSSRTSPKKTLSPNKRSPQSTSSQPGHSPAKHPKKFSSLPATPIPATSPAKTPTATEISTTPIDLSGLSTAPKDLPGPSTAPKDLPGPSTAPDVLPKELPEQLPEELAKELPEELAKELPEELAKELPEELAKELPEELAKELPEEIPAELPEVLPEELAEEVQEPVPDPATAEIIPNEETVIEITLNDKTLGIEILGGSDTFIKGPAAVVLEVFKEGAAAQDGRLKVGDQIRECNGIVIHEDMVSQRVHLSIKLKVEKMKMTVYRPDPLQFEEIETELKKKSGKPFGLGCIAHLWSPGVYLNDILAGSAAEKNGKLQKGDFLVKVGDKDVSNLNPIDVATILKLCDNKITIKVKRFKIIPWEIPVEKMQKKLKI